MLLALRLSLEDMFHEWGHTLLGIVGLAVVVANFFILSALSGSFSRFLNTNPNNSNLIVIQNDLIDPSDATLEPQAIQVAQEMVPATIRRISPTVFRHTRIDNHVVLLRAAALEDWEPVYHLTLLRGTWPTIGSEIAAGEGVALANAWEIGSVVEIFGSAFHISGIFRSPGTAFASVWMPIDTFWGLFDTQRGYQLMYVQAAAGVEPETVRSLLQNDPRLATRYTVYFEDNYMHRDAQFFKDISSLITIISGVALLGIIFGIFNAATLSTVERGRELGILLGIGFSHGTVSRFMLVRSIFQALLAYGVGLATAFIYITGQQAFAPLFVLGIPLALKISPAMAASGLAWVVVMAILGAWLSTRRLFHLRVVELLSEA